MSSEDTQPLWRWPDRAGWRHRVAVGPTPPAVDAWKVGELWRTPPAGGIPLQCDREGRVHTPGYTPPKVTPGARGLARFALEPLAWPEVGSIPRRVRLTLARAAAARRRVSEGRGTTPPSTEAPEPIGWLRSVPDDGAPALFAATHPAWGDQLLTRDPGEPAALGYGSVTLLGYLAAPSSVESPAGELPWAARLGRRRTAAADPVAFARDRAAGEASPEVPLLFPLGHFYSPVLGQAEIDAAASRVWPARPPEVLELAWQEDAQRRLLDAFATRPPLPLRSDPGPDPTEYWSGNDQYPPLDAQVLAAMLRELRPARMVEIGCGFSTLVTARVNREVLGDAMHFTCVEPYPRQFLLDGVPGVSELRVEQVQDAPLEVFTALGAGDVLFVDTSHTVKTGNDVTWIFAEILPRLAPGVSVHVHDIFLPFDYPEVWVRQGRGWTEQYLLRAFLAYSERFEITWATRFMADRHPEAVRRTFGVESLDGGSFWMRRR